MASSTSVHTVRKVTVVTVPLVIVQVDHTETTVTQDNHTMLITLCLPVSMGSGYIVTHISVVKLWFTLSASARAVAPDSPISFHVRLWKSVLQN